MHLARDQMLKVGDSVEPGSWYFVFLVCFLNLTTASVIAETV